MQTMSLAGLIAQAAQGFFGLCEVVVALMTYLPIGNDGMDKMLFNMLVSWGVTEVLQLGAAYSYYKYIEAILV